MSPNPFIVVLNKSFGFARLFTSLRFESRQTRSRPTQHTSHDKSNTFENFFFLMKVWRKGKKKDWGICRLKEKGRRKCLRFEGKPGKKKGWGICESKEKAGEEGFADWRKREGERLGRSRFEGREGERLGLWTTKTNQTVGWLLSACVPIWFCLRVLAPRTADVNSWFSRFKPSAFLSNGSVSRVFILAEGHVGKPFTLASPRCFNCVCVHACTYIRLVSKIFPHYASNRNQVCFCRQLSTWQWSNCHRNLALPCLDRGATIQTNRPTKKCFRFFSFLSPVFRDALQSFH